MRLVVAVVMLVPHMLHRAAVALAKCIAIVAHQIVLYPRMLVCGMIIRIAMPMFGEIPACRLDTVVESRALCVTVLRRGFVPTALSLVLGL